MIRLKYIKGIKYKKDENNNIQKSKKYNNEKKAIKIIKKSKKITIKIFNFIIHSVLVIFLIGTIFATIGVVSGFVYYEINYKDYVDEIADSMSYSDFELDNKQTIYYSDGSVMLTYAPFTTETIKNENDITDVIRKVTLAAEDERFYEHNGVDLYSIGRAIVANVKSKGNVQGASTITQQLVKLSYLSSEKSYDRKIKEAAISLKVEQRFNKNEILQLYLNRIYFGNGVYGIADASQYYFSKSYKDLTYDEAASLIAIVNSPTNLEPINNYDNNQARKKRILKIAGVNSNEHTKFNIQEGYGVAYTFSTEGTGCISYIESLLENNEDIGTEVNTTIDKDLQIKIEDMVDELKEPLQASVVVIDNNTGKVIAIVGGKKTDNIFSLNRAFQSPRQTGSSIKPLLDYGVIFDTYNIDTDFEVVDKGGKGMPKNSGGGHRGRCTIKVAATKSINTVAFRLYSYLVDDGYTPLEYLEKMNFSHLVESDYKAKAVSIGGFTYGATTLEMASGYATLANSGLYREPTALVDVDPEPVQVYSPIAAYWTTDLLSEVATKGTARKLKVDVPISCKTGTTNNNKDAWLCGYTKDYTIAIWCGADNKNANYSVKSSGEVLQIFQQILDSVELVDEPIYNEQEASRIIANQKSRKNPIGLEEYFNELSPKPKPQPVQPTPEIPVPVEPVVPTEPVIQIYDENGNIVGQQ